MLAEIEPQSPGCSTNPSPVTGSQPGAVSKPGRLQFGLEPLTISFRTSGCAYSAGLMKPMGPLPNAVRSSLSSVTIEALRKARSAWDWRAEVGNGGHNGARCVPKVRAIVQTGVADLQDWCRQTRSIGMGSRLVDVMEVKVTIHRNVRVAPA
jgi:hypothetical protein